MSQKSTRNKSIISQNFRNYRIFSHFLRERMILSTSCIALRRNGFGINLLQQKQEQTNQIAILKIIIEFASCWIDFVWEYMRIPPKGMSQHQRKHSLLRVKRNGHQETVDYGFAHLNLWFRVHWLKEIPFEGIKRRTVKSMNFRLKQEKLHARELPFRVVILTPHPQILEDTKSGAPERAYQSSFGYEIYWKRMISLMKSMSNFSNV